MGVIVITYKSGMFLQIVVSLYKTNQNDPPSSSSSNSSRSSRRRRRSSRKKTLCLFKVPCRRARRAGNRCARMQNMHVDDGLRRMATAAVAAVSGKSASLPEQHCNGEVQWGA